MESGLDMQSSPVEAFRYEKTLLLAFFLITMIWRFLHLGGPLDVPTWRQADTGYMALRMMDECPPDMLQPKAPYRGSEDVKAAEFPIYPMLASYIYRLAGKEWLPGARCLTLLFFSGAVAYLFFAIKLLAGWRVAAYVAVVYCLLPLGIPYSRMIHPDFSIIFFSHAFFFHGLAFFEKQGWKHYIFATLAFTAAFLMKAPYAFYFGIPLGAWVFWKLEHWSIRNFALMASLLVLPMAGAMWFNDLRIQMEAPFQESVVYP